MAASVESYNKKYLRMKPEVTQIFDMLDEYLDFVRLQYPAVPFDPSTMYHNSSETWRRFTRSRNQPYRNEQQAQR
jgi:hypothetical protein